MTSNDELWAQPYLGVLPARARTRLITPANCADSPDENLREACGLFLTGGPDTVPAIYESPVDLGILREPCQSLYDLELGILRKALTLNMPILAICRGMHLMNLAFGGAPPQDITGHIGDNSNTTKTHSIYLSPGSKLAAILGMGGFFKVNTNHNRGIREIQRAPRLLASAYSLEDGIIEGLESPEHKWVVGVQFNPETQEGVPRIFSNLFEAFIDRTEDTSHEEEAG